MNRRGTVGLALCGLVLTSGCGALSAPAPQEAPLGSDAAVIEEESPPPSAVPDASSEPATVRLAFAGDSYAEGPLAYRLSSDPDGFVGPFARTLRNADLAVLNLETAITTATTPEPKAYTFGVSQAILPALDAAGVDVVSLANNHGMDFGWPGFRDSIQAKEDSQSPVILGIGADQEEAYDPHIAEVAGQRIAVFAATQVLDDNLLDKWTATAGKGGLASAKRVGYLTQRISEARAEADTIVVFLHWGVERYTCPTQDQIELAEALRDAGADVIVGGHQHRLAGGGRLGDAFVHYGLGNFLFQAASAEAVKTGVLTVDVRGREVVDYKWLPGRVVNAVPQRLRGADRAAELAYWESLRECADLQP